MSAEKDAKIVQKKLQRGLDEDLRRIRAAEVVQREAKVVEVKKILLKPMFFYTF